MRACGSFTAEEVVCGLEMADVALAGSGEYEWFVALDGAQLPRGFLCVGAASLAERVFELYWIWVDPQARGNGIAGRLMEFFDEVCHERSQRLATIYTSSTAPYAAARSLYERHGFRVAARLDDFYRPQDDLIVYRKDYSRGN